MVEQKKHFGWLDEPLRPLDDKGIVILEDQIFDSMSL